VGAENLDLDLLQAEDGRVFARPPCPSLFLLGGPPPVPSSLLSYLCVCVCGVVVGCPERCVNPFGLKEKDTVLPLS